VATTRSELSCWRLPPSVSPAASPDPILLAPSSSIPGAAGIKRFSVLPARRYILTEDTSGDAALWDICTGSCTQRYPKLADAKKGSYDRLLKEARKEKVSVPNWFSVGTKSGQLEITLEPDSCFSAEAYIEDIGLATQSDMRINFGERLLAVLFEEWRVAFLAQSGMKDPLEGKEALPSLQWRYLPEVPILISQGGVVMHKCNADSLDRAPPELIPNWVVQSVLHGSYPLPPSLKLSFFLSPHPSDDLPSLPPGVNKLSASKFLKMHKVASYVASKLPNIDDEAEPELILSCNDQELRRETSLASVQAFIWKSPGEDMQLQYRRGVAEAEA